MTHAALLAGTSAFLASFVEFLEALTVVLAIGSVRGWRAPLAGTGLALVTLAALVTIARPALAWLATGPVRLAIGLLVLLFGMRWLRRAVQRSSGLRPLHDEAAEYEKTRTQFGPATRIGFDRLAALGAFQVVMIEGIEVAFIVAAIGAAPGLGPPAATGAAAALALVLVLGAALHRPIASIPENLLKFAVGVLLCAFGTFWTGEGLGAAWPGGDLALPALALFWLAVALGTVRLATATAAA